MQNKTDDTMTTATLEVVDQGSRREIFLKGCWSLRNVAEDLLLQKRLAKIGQNSTYTWNLLQLEQLDAAVALILWQAWGEKIPLNSQIKAEHLRLFERWYKPFEPARKTEKLIRTLIVYIVRLIENFFDHILNWTALLGKLFLDSCYLFKHPSKIPWLEIAQTIFDAGVRALGITALVGFLIGIVLSYLSSLQLQIFGAEIYIIDILGMSIIRELGPLLAAILVAGRSGSAMTAQLGIMRVTEELDALSAMGISHSLRLILPKVVALVVILPLLTVWTDAAGLFGGMLSAQNMLDISFQQFFLRLPDAVPLANVFIGLGKAAVFGLMIALIACHYGFHIKPNTESLGHETTNSVVASITVVIIVDAIFAILTRDVGLP